MTKNKKYTARQTQIINNAIELIAHKGIQGLTIKSLSAKTGVVESAIYRHFKNKAVILNSVFNYLKEFVLNNYNNIEISNLPTIKKLKKLFDKQLELLSKNPSFVIILLSDENYKNNLLLQKITYSIILESRQRLSVILESGIKNGEIRSDIKSEQLAFVFMANMRLFVTQWVLSGFSFDLKKNGKKLWNTLNKIIINK
jgi:AcrR family transcriptional regulator